jgi:hypothetical protein
MVTAIVADNSQQRFESGPDKRGLKSLMPEQAYNDPDYELDCGEQESSVFLMLQCVVRNLELLWEHPRRSPFQRLAETEPHR